jgi:hypothetical protein
MSAEARLCPSCWRGALLYDEHGRTDCIYRCGTEAIISALLRLAPGESATGNATRYDGRRVDLAALLAEPPKPIPWRVRDVIADGTLTILSGESGSGKSWVAQALCTGVARGGTLGGLECVQGRALYADGEMGPAMFVDQRLRPAGIETPEFAYLDMMGLDVSAPADLEWLRSEIAAEAADLVVIDSLRRLAPSKPENDSDAMAPVVSSLAKLARDTRAAVLLLHHKGDGEKLFRGSTAIRDQCDALLGLVRDDESSTRRLTVRGGGKMRYSVEPPDRYLAVSPLDGGIVATAPSEPKAMRTEARSLLADAIRGALPAETRSAVAMAVGRQPEDRAFRAAWSALEEADEIAHNGSGWVCPSISTPREKWTDRRSPELFAVPDPTPCPSCGGALANVAGQLACFGCNHTTTGRGSVEGEPA